MRRPHSEKQRAMITYPGNVAAFCGRRFGKTDAYVTRLFYHMQRRPGLYWWVGLSWRSASMKRAFRIVTYYARRILRSLGITDRGYINRSTYEVKIPRLGEIWFRTADNPESMAGEGIFGAVLDEFSLMSEIVWTEYVQATLLDYGGWAAFGGVPKGHNWAANLWRSAAEREGWCQIHATSYDNPFMSRDRLDKIRDENPELIFRQEYLAEIVSGEGQVFRRIMEAAILTPPPGPIPGRAYVAGVDIANEADFTAISVIDPVARHQVYLDRFNRVGYLALEDRIEVAYRRWNVQTMVIEDNSIGQPVIDHLRRRGLRIVPFHTSHASKQPLIQELQSAFEHDAIRILNDPVQVNELQSYESKPTAAGYSYAAPAGMHDDTVMALALSWYATRSGAGAI
jgi:hypothetical protein